MRLAHPPEEDFSASFAGSFFTFCLFLLHLSLYGMASLVVQSLTFGSDLGTGPI